MSKIRVYELAKELKVSSKDLIRILMEEFSVEVKNHMSVIEDEDAELIKELLSGTDSKSIVDQYEEELAEEVNNVKKKKKKKGAKAEEVEELDVEVIEIGETITVKDLAEKLKKPNNEVIRVMMFEGVMAGLNQEINFEIAQKVAEKFEIEAYLKEEEELLEEFEEEEIDTASLETRPAIITVMGHVDHGKTSILDAIRKTKVATGEAGGITQHIGAYTVQVDGETLTFLDTPGHEAFTAMRARGAQITDVVILVVAADDGIMPQTAEAINHCKAAKVPMVVAINKIDREGADVERVKAGLAEHGLVVEDWGGDVVAVPVSAKTGEGLDTLLEMVVLSAEMQSLVANPHRKAKGTVIESKLDKGRGAVASLLVQDGTLSNGDSIFVGNTYGRIRAMFDDAGKAIKTAGPSIPVEILGLSEVPAAGDRFIVVKDEKTARQMAEKRVAKQRQESFNASNRVSLEDLYSQIKEGKVKELSVIVKADVQGSVEAIKVSLEKLSTDDVKVRVIHGGVGAITETDVTLSTASNALLIGFNVRPTVTASMLASKDDVEIKTYSIIYEAIEDVKSAMIGMLDPIEREVILGNVEIRATYKISAVGTIAGCYVLDGKIVRNAGVRIIRDGIVVKEGKLASLKRFKDDAKEVKAGYECGLSIENYNDIREGDIIEAYTMEQIIRKEL
ncbi:MAG: translation initiation factor IF-2 [Sarcina sp.]